MYRSLLLVIAAAAVSPLAFAQTPPTPAPAPAPAPAPPPASVIDEIDAEDRFEAERRKAERQADQAPQTEPPAGEGMTEQDFRLVRAQQTFIGDIEAGIARLNELRAQGKCAELRKHRRLVDEMIDNRRGKISFPDGRQLSIPPETLDALQRRVNAATAPPCPPEPPQPVPTAIYVPPPNSAEAHILALHNQTRAQVGSPPLIWDLQLAAQAAAYGPALARYGRPTHAPRKGRESSRENLLQALPGTPVDRMVGVWIAERQHFMPGTFPNVSRTGNWADVGHYTQMVWRSTTHVGCAIHRGGRFDWLICRYSPPGNKDGKPVF